MLGLSVICLFLMLRDFEGGNIFILLWAFRATIMVFIYFYCGLLGPQLCFLFIFIVGF